MEDFKIEMRKYTAKLFELAEEWQDQSRVEARRGNYAAAAELKAKVHGLIRAMQIADNGDFNTKQS